MQINRQFTKPGIDPFTQFTYKLHDAIVKDWTTGQVIFEAKGIEMPEQWGDQACDICISKYFRKAGVPSETEAVPSIKVPAWLLSRQAAPGSAVTGEKSIRQVIHRLAGHWTYTGFIHGYFNPSKEECDKRRASRAENTVEAVAIFDILQEQNAKSFYDEMVYLLLAQAFAPNSPQWFNTGLWWAYGIKGNAQGHYHMSDQVSHNAYADHKVADLCWRKASEGKMSNAAMAIDEFAVPSRDAYSHVSAHACFILSLKDNMLQHQGIYSWIEREARIFKFGSGSGVNISALRGKDEKLSGGGVSSGAMAWMGIADNSAGAIKSGGTTRRAAKMVCMDLDHPDILEFIGCKVKTELLVAAMHTGSLVINQRCNKIIDACKASGLKTQKEMLANRSVVSAMRKAKKAGVPDNYVHRAVTMAASGHTRWIGNDIDLHYEGVAYSTVPFQNANNSIRIPSDFYKAVDLNGQWQLINRVGSVAREVDARSLENAIAEAAWFCGDPGIHYDTIVNEWNVTPKDGRINASNPCSEHMRLDGSACNLASFRLTFFWKAGQFLWSVFEHVVGLIQIVLDITNAMAQLPDKETAINVFMFRDTGLGFADLGSLLMHMGLAYDSDEARAVAGTISSYMQATCHVTSAKMAKELGAYPRFSINRDDHMRCVINHSHASSGRADAMVGLTIKPQCINRNHLDAAIGVALSEQVLISLASLWQTAITMGHGHGYRNAEMTVIAPTGTIGFVMGCDTTGVEPMAALVANKSLAGGGSMTLIPKTSVESALNKLGYGTQNIEYVADKNGQTKGIRFIGVKEKDLAVFDTAIGDKISGRSIAWEGHVKMMAAVQSFISGAISKTVNLPITATVEDMKNIYRVAHDMGVKAIAVYRDCCKLNQPLNIDKEENKTLDSDFDELGIDDEWLASVPKIEAAIKQLTMKATTMGMVSPLDTAVRVRLGSVRKSGINVAVGLGRGTLYVQTTRFDDGKLGEIWLNYSADAGIIQALLGGICRIFNMGLQYGVPPEALLSTMIDTRFSPDGMTTGHDHIKVCTSILNLAARIIAFHELNDDSVANVTPKQAKKMTNNDKAVVDEAIREGATLGLVVSLAGEKCPACNSPNYVTSGNGCKKCENCGHAGGCG